MDNFLNELFNGFHSIQLVLFRLIQSWQEYFYLSAFVGIILVELSNAYYCLPHDLLIAKLTAYGLDKKSLFLVGYCLGYDK